MWTQPQIQTNVEMNEAGFIAGKVRNDAGEEASQGKGLEH